MNNNQVEIMTAAPHLIISGEHGCGKSVLLSWLVNRLMRQRESVVMLAESMEELAEAIEDVGRIFNKRQSQYDEVVRQAVRVFGGDVEVMNDEQKCYYRKRLAMCVKTFDEVWLLVDDFSLNPNNQSFITNILRAGTPGNIHLGLVIQSPKLSGLSMGMVGQAHWYRAVEPYRFEFTDIAEWQRSNL